MESDDKDKVNHRIESLYEKGQELVNHARETDDLSVLNEAEHVFNQILNLKPSNLAGIFFLGCIHMLKKNEGLAQVLFSAVYKADKQFINAANNLGILFKNSEQRKKAVGIYKEAIETMENQGRDIFPDNETYNDTLADLYSNMGSCFTSNGTPEIALEYYHKSLSFKDRIDRDTPRFNMSLAYLELGDYENAWKNYKYYSVVHPEKRIKNYHEKDNPTPKWEGDKTQVVAVLGEQGLGDELMFATILPDMMQDIKIVFDCHPRLQNLFKRAWPHMPIYGTRKDLDSVWQQGLRPDSFIPISEIAEYYRNNKEDFPGTPYLTSDERLKPLLPNFLREKNDKLKIGFSWTGGLAKTNLLFRTIPYPELLRMLSLDCEFFSLQYKPEHNEELLTICNQHGLNNVHVYQNLLDNYDLTACMLNELDFIVCAPQSVIYLAGALGVETYQLCPKRGMWQQGVYGEDSPWFKSVRNIWQTDFNEWGGCMDEVIKVINGKIS